MKQLTWVYWAGDKRLTKALNYGPGLLRYEPSIFQPIFFGSPILTQLYAESSAGIQLFQRGHNSLVDPPGGILLFTTLPTDTTSGDVTGVYDDDTINEVAHFQADLGLFVDGYVGPQTMRAYDNLLTAYAMRLIDRSTKSEDLQKIANAPAPPSPPDPDPYAGE